MKRAVVLLSSVLVCGLVLPSAAAQTSGERFADEVFDEIVTTSDIAYGQATNSRGELETLRLDVHEPAGDTIERRPVYVWVHGGYFKRGHKAEDYHVAELHKITRAGYVTVSINYRLRPELPEGAGPAVMEARVDEYIDAVVDAQHDAQAAVRWVRANASTYRLDPERIAIGGHSAGAITAASVAFNSDDPGDSGNPGWSSRVAAAVSHAGGSLPVRLARIDAGEPPMLFLHGVTDDVVPYPAAVMPCAATLAMLNVCEQVLRPVHGHGLFGGEHAREFLYRWLIDRPSFQPRARVTVVP